MKILGDLNSLIAELTKIRDKYGNLDVYLADWGEEYRSPAAVGSVEVRDLWSTSQFIVLLDT